MPDIRDEMSISHQEETGSRKRGLPIINLKLLAAEGHIKTFAFSRTFKFYCLFYLQVTVSFLAVEFTTRSHSRDHSGVVLQYYDHFNTSEVKHVSDNL